MWGVKMVGRRKGRAPLFAAGAPGLAWDLQLN